MVRYGMDSDYERAKEIWEECFRDSAEEVNFYFKNLYDTHKYLVLEEDGEIKASLHENPYKLNINGNVFDSIYIVGVAVSPEYRGKGYMNTLLKECLKENYKRGVPFLFLSPINPEIYRKYGFEYVTTLDKVSFNFDSLVYTKIERAYDLKRVVVDSEDEIFYDLIQIYKNKMKDYFLYVERDVEYYKAWIKEIRSDGGEVYAIYLDREIKGYIALYKDEKVIVREIFSSDRRAFENLLAFLNTYREYYKEVEIKNPTENSLVNYFTNQKRLKRESLPFIMGRVLNVKEFLEMLNIYGVEFSIQVTDNLILENNGVYSFSSDGELNFSKDGEWDIKVDITDFSSLVFGQLGLEELLFLEKIEIKSENILNLFKEKNIFNLKKNYIQDYQ